RDHLVEGDVASTRILDVYAHRELLVGRTDASGDESGLARIAPSEFVSCPAGKLGGCLVDCKDLILKSELRQPNSRPVERVGLNDIRPGFQIGAVNAVDQVGLSEDQHLGAILEIARMRGKWLTPKLFLIQLMRINQRTHRSVQKHDSSG